MNTLPDVFKNSVTWDQGGGMGRHKQFTLAPMDSQDELDAIADELDDRPLG